MFRADVPVSGTLKILATDPVALAGTSTAAFTVIRDGDTNADLTVELSIGGTSTNGEDYATTANEVVIPAGFLAVDIPIFPFIDMMTRGNKTIVRIAALAVECELPDRQT